MKFCQTCGRVKFSTFTSGYRVFGCACGSEEKGEPADACIISVKVIASDTIEMFTNLIRNAPFDRTSQRVKRNCGECPLNYMVQVRVGDAEVIVYKCKCGFEETN